MKSSEESQRFSAIFEDDPVIVVPIITESIKKSEETEEEKFEEKICHLQNDGKTSEENQMLGGDFSFNAKLKEPIKKNPKSNFQKNREIIQKFLETNVEKMLKEGRNSNNKEERRLVNRIIKAGEKNFMSN
jgi:hypothetical protein